MLIHSICQSRTWETNCGGHLTMHKRDIKPFWLNLDERLNVFECLPDFYDMTFLTSSNKKFYSIEIFKKKMVKMTYMCTHAYVRVRRITVTSFLQFKFYKQDNSSHDTGQIFVVIFSWEKKHILNIISTIILHCLQSPNEIVAHRVPFIMSGHYFHLVKFWLEAFPYLFCYSSGRSKHLVYAWIFSLLNIVYIFSLLALDQTKIDQIRIKAKNYIALDTLYTTSHLIFMWSNY